VLACENCGGEAMLFNGLEHGYDGEVGNADNFKDETTRRKLFWRDGTPKRHDRVFAQFIYGIDPADLSEMAKKSGKPVVDLFDWFNVVEDDPKGEPMWEYECA
jgi:hypothetical protein